MTDSAVLGWAESALGGRSSGGFIEGGSVETRGKGLVVENPSTRDELAVLAEATAADVEDAVASARAAYVASWGTESGVTRARTLSAICTSIREHAESLARIETLDTGKPLRQAQSDVETAARYFEFYAGVADKIYGHVIPGEGRYWSYSLREPHGVVAIVTPWNSPLSQMSRSLAPCLAAGNTAVVKPSEVTPLSSLVAARLFVEAGLPPGVCNVVVGRGGTTGTALIRHPDVRYLSFTGSVATGKEVLSTAGSRIVGCSVELGGKSPTLVLPDANLDAAVSAGVQAVVRNAGQSCFATTRLIVHRSIADEYIHRLCCGIARLRLGPGIEDPDVGPLVSESQLQKVRDAIGTGVREGALLAVGGVEPEDLAGYFITPAVLTNVRNDMKVAREEIFGPVQSVLVFDELEEAIASANDSTYGLAAGIFTRDIAVAHRLARRLEAGQIHINGYPLGGVETPFGGYKESGIGREKGIAALEHYTQLKTVIVSDV